MSPPHWHHVRETLQCLMPDRNPPYDPLLVRYHVWKPAAGGPAVATDDKVCSHRYETSDRGWKYVGVAAVNTGTNEINAILTSPEKIPWFPCPEHFQPVDLPSLDRCLTRIKREKASFTFGKGPNKREVNLFLPTCRCSAYTPSKQLPRRPQPRATTSSAREADYTDLIRQHIARIEKETNE